MTASVYGQTHQIEPQGSYKVCSYKNKSVAELVVTIPIHYKHATT